MLLLPKPLLISGFVCFLLRHGDVEQFPQQAQTVASAFADLVYPQQK
ncbi:hypothetical protein L911_2960 [Vibrio fluvialis I21563]|uniref:Uncharacterized protein n=1 Tax=Vibrio fluvialis PG41 TaxID=1336752 RepID=S7JKU8_VIBFL|nr:hypothetical protein L911_2960 [Vibrio fluvialis I21563]EPP24716.1 hypothetical protein L910_2162 [Vibrio fluvialis PG41]